jgi:hypothetical protein
MSGSTTELNLATAVDTDDNADYLTLSLANSLRTVDALFNNVTGHNHGGAHQGGAIAPSAIPGGSITNAMLGADVARDNLLTNGGFEIWQRGAGPFTASGSWSADRWMVAPVGTMSVSRDTANAAQSGGTCAAIVATGGPTNLLVSYLIPNTTEGQEFRGRTYSLSARVKCSVANGCRLSLFDSTGATALGAYHTGGGAYETLTVTGTAGASASQFQARVVFDVAGTYYVDNAMLVVGSQAANYVPMHPADDFARCLRYYEVVGALQNEIVFTFYGGAGITTGTLFGFKARKAITPTFTKNATWLVSNCGQPIILSGSVDTVSLAVLVTATGTTSYNNNIAGANVVMEANP